MTDAPEFRCPHGFLRSVVLCYECGPLAPCGRSRLASLKAEPELKTCKVCGDTKPLTMFPQRSDASGRRRAYCRVCEGQRAKQSYQRKRAARAP